MAKGKAGDRIFVLKCFKVLVPQEICKGPSVPTAKYRSFLVAFEELFGLPKRIGSCFGHLKPLASRRISTNCHSSSPTATHSFNLFKSKASGG